MTNDKHISANDLITAIRDDVNIDGRTFARVKEHIEKAKDAVKHGRWNRIPIINSLCRYQCDRCLHWVDAGTDRNYCPNCGAKMDGDGNEID